MKTNRERKGNYSLLTNDQEDTWRTSDGTSTTGHSDGQDEGENGATSHPDRTPPSGGTPEPKSSGPDSHLEGGWGWIVVLSAFATKAIFTGVMKSMGVLIPTLAEQFSGTSVAHIGLICSLFATFSDFTGLFSSSLCQTFGYRPVAITGGVVCSAGMMSASLVQSPAELGVSLGVAGLGFGLSVVPGMACLGQYFNVRFALTNGMVYAGTGVGIIVMTPLAQIFLDTYGWRGTMLLIGAICLHVMLNGALLRPPTTPTTKRSQLMSMNKENQGFSGTSMNGTDGYNSLRDSTKSGRFRKLWTTIKYLFVVKLFENKLFVLTLICVFCGRFLLFAWLLFYVPHLEEKGLSPNLSVSIAVIAGICNMVSRATHGLIIDFGLLTAEQLYLICSGIVVLSLTLDPFLHTYGPNMAAGILFGVANGVSLPLGTVLLKQSVTRADFISALSWSYCFGGIARLLAGYSIGRLFDRFGNFDIAFVVLGIVSAVAGVVIFMFMVIKRKEAWK